MGVGSLTEKCWPMGKMLSYMPGTREKCCRVKVLMNDKTTIRFLLAALARLSNVHARSSCKKKATERSGLTVSMETVYMSMQGGAKKTHL